MLRVGERIEDHTDQALDDRARPIVELWKVDGDDLPVLAHEMSRLYAAAGSGAVWPIAGRRSDRSRLPQTSAPTAKRPAAHQNAVV